MNKDSGFYSIATDNISFYISNASRNSVCKIGPDGTFHKNVIIIENPLSLAIGGYRLFVQTPRFIHVYEFVNDIPVKKNSIPFESSVLYPSIVCNPNDNLLYISNYTTGTITTMDSSGVFTRIVNGVVGVSGLCIASKILYFSNVINNTVSFYTNNTVQTYLVIPSPRGLCNSPNGLCICYGSNKNYGIALNKLGTDYYTNIFKLYLNGNIPLTVVSDGKSIYYTLSNMNVVYKNDTIYGSTDFIDIFFNDTDITQSVVTRNIKCLMNPAFSGLIALRTYGSSPTNPVIPITTLLGRSQGSQVKILPGLGISYEELKMRRKAEVLKYKSSETSHIGSFTKKQNFSNLANNGGSYYYSKARINKLIKESNCKIGVNNGSPIVKTPPTNSGIIDPTFEGYYLNPYVPYYPSL